MEHSSIINEGLWDKNKDIDTLMSLNNERFILENKGEELTSSQELFEIYFAQCLILSRMFFQGQQDSAFIDSDYNVVKSTIEYMYNKFFSIEFDKEFLKNIINTSSSYLLNNGGALYGDSGREQFNFFDCYSLNAGSPFVGIKKFLSYAQFLNCVRDGKYQEANSIAKNIDLFIKLSNDYQNNETEIAYEKSIKALFEDLLRLSRINVYSKDFDDDITIESLFSKVPLIKNKFYINPTIKLIAYYIRTIEDEKYKKYIMSILIVFPNNDDINQLHMEMYTKDSLIKIKDLTNQIKQNKEDLDSLSNKLIEATNTPNKQIMLDSIRERYYYIDFDNLHDKTMQFVTTGDYIYEILMRNNVKNIDYSPAIIEWSKAVELETKNKIYAPIKNSKNEIKNKLKIEGKIEFKKIDSLGAVRHLFGCRETIYNNIIKIQYVGISEESFYELLTNIDKLADDYRNDSGHGDVKTRDIALGDANKCKKLVLNSKKILETLSKMYKKTELS